MGAEGQIVNFISGIDLFGGKICSGLREEEQGTITDLFMAGPGRGGKGQIFKLVLPGDYYFVGGVVCAGANIQSAVQGLDEAVKVQFTIKVELAPGVVLRIRQRGLVRIVQLGCKVVGYRTYVPQILMVVPGKDSADKIGDDLGAEINL